ncbi:MAG: GntR family transcriptional regulator [Chloroflexi bacterium]|nr:GntR family transcriptional regulator [Chloroflexota bacterium]
MVRLKRNHPQPLYAQLKESLRSDILAGRLRAHQQLPSERELCARFRVSRMTVRQALLDLTREGLIYSRAGKGTFASEPKIDQQLKALSGFSQDMQSRGSKPSSRVLEAKIERAKDDVAKMLGVLPGAEIVLLTRVRLSDNIPLAIETVHLPHALCPNLLRHNFATESLYAVLEHEYGYRLTRAEQTIEAALARSREAALLRLAAPAPVLVMERVTYTDQGILIEHVHSIYRGDRYKFHSTLAPQGIAS